MRSHKFRFVVVTFSLPGSHLYHSWMGSIWPQTATRIIYCRKMNLLLLSTITKNRIKGSILHAGPLSRSRKSYENCDLMGPVSTLMNVKHFWQKIYQDYHFRFKESHMHAGVWYFFAQLHSIFCKLLLPQHLFYVKWKCFDLQSSSGNFQQRVKLYFCASFICLQAKE